MSIWTFKNKHNIQPNTNLSNGEDAQALMAKRSIPRSLCTEIQKSPIILITYLLRTGSCQTLSEWKLEIKSNGFN